jgi:LysM repeat protein
MSAKNVFRLLMIAIVLVTSLGFAPGALANAACGDSYTVVKGDTLRKIANRCDTSVSALQRANPQIKNPNLIYPGQVLVIPGAMMVGDGTYDVYVVQRGDTLSEIAKRFGTTTSKLLELNPAIKNASVIYEGQRLKVPVTKLPDTGSTQVYIVQKGDTLRKIAARFDTTVAELLELNPIIKNPNLIYTGQRLLVPVEVTTYTVQRGDTLKAIANRFDTTVQALLKLNPSIKDPDVIFVGQVLRIS